jgi:hypothetical protein
MNLRRPYGIVDRREAATNKGILNHDREVVINSLIAPIKVITLYPQSLKRGRDENYNC